MYVTHHKVDYFITACILDHCSFMVSFTAFQSKSRASKHRVLASVQALLYLVITGVGVPVAAALVIEFHS